MTVNSAGVMLRKMRVYDLFEESSRRYQSFFPYWAEYRSMLRMHHNKTTAFEAIERIRSILKSTLD
jgi:uncharacterized protein YfbU (UPF0304 family)